MATLQAIPLKNIRIQDKFWTPKMELIRDKVIPYQWEILNDRVPGAEKSHCIKNFEIAAGRCTGEYYGAVFQDSDLYKWLESVSYSLTVFPDPQLEELADGAIALIAEAQGADGYLNTFYTIKEPHGRWTNLQEGHEMYCAGHFIEAAVAYHDATGKEAVLTIARRLADCLDRTFGPGQGQIRAYPGHEEIELALYKLYRSTGEKRYRNLAAFFLNERGREPNYFAQELKTDTYKRIFPELEGMGWEYFQAHAPVREHTKATGHAVRAVYLYSAMADLAQEMKDEELLTACETLYRNITRQQMYVTGAIGSTFLGEQFSCDYDLPNQSVYGETCASIGLLMFCQRMQLATGEGEYADTGERALYNNVLSGISLSGTEFFYVNPLEVIPRVCDCNTSLRHVKPERQRWFSVACCPPNIARTVMSLGQYLYARSDSAIYINLYVSGSATCDLDGAQADIRVETRYPYGGETTVTASGGVFDLYLRSPGHSPIVSAEIDGVAQPLTLEKGYLHLSGDWKGQTVRLRMAVEPKWIYADPRISADVGKVALQRGPFVYCLEEMDNGENLAALVVDTGSPLEEEPVPIGLPQNGVAVRGASCRLAAFDGGELYRSEAPKTWEARPFTAIPYHLWGNRGRGEMRVWVQSK